MRPDLKIIARGSEEEATPKLLRAGATQVVSPYHFVGRRIAQLLMRPNVLDFVEAAFGTQRLDVQLEEVRVSEGSDLVGQTLGKADIRQRTGTIILALKRGEDSMKFNPPPDAVIAAGDCLIAVGSTEHLKQLEQLAYA
jgi:voltage-gated potassium channel